MVHAKEEELRCALITCEANGKSLHFIRGGRVVYKIKSSIKKSNIASFYEQNRCFLVRDILCSMKKNGFTLIEVIIAVFVLTVGAVGVFSVVNYALSSSNLIASRLIASYLAQEGLEVARNIRDGNWLEKQGNPSLEWNDGLPPGDREADYRTGTNAGEGLPAFSNNYLGISPGGFYIRPPGQESTTQFKRRINIVRPDSTTVEVTVFVTWQERGRTHTVIARDVLRNWY